ncbi:MAG: hypothetical protein H6656_22075 [Ardenticatenaceae bacterium]|nr:hypothetical protein [Anaerolineales bacterium]MCB9010024.1 hypothetical protein [Ardenticatenaceae bacterium]
MNGFDALFSLANNFYSFLTGATGYGIALWFLTTIFAWSGLVKLRRPTSTAMAIVDFGVVRRVHPALGWFLGAVELILAILLALRLLPQLTLLLTAMLLWLFTIVIARSLWQGETFACFCFGDADSELSRWTLLRTGTLALLTTLITFAPVPGISSLGFQSSLLQAIIAWSLLGTIVLISNVLRLARWSTNPFDQTTTNSTMEVSR